MSWVPPSRAHPARSLKRHGLGEPRVSWGQIFVEHQITMLGTKTVNIEEYAFRELLLN